MITKLNDLRHPTTGKFIGGTVLTTELRRRVDLKTFTISKTACHLRIYKTDTTDEPMVTWLYKKECRALAAALNAFADS